MTKKEAGALGGKKTSEKYGLKPYHCEKYHRLCPLAMECKSEFHANNAKKSTGGIVTSSKYTHDHYVAIGKKGGRGNKKNANL